MAWGRSKQEKAQEASTSQLNTHSSKQKESGSSTIIGPTLVVTGEMKTERAMFIEGKIVGNIVSTSNIHVGSAGLIEGNIKCDSILVEGKVNGNVDATTNITIEATGRLSGDIVTREFINRPGGFFEGYSHMTGESRPKNTAEKKQSKNKHEKAGIAEP